LPFSVTRLRSRAYSGNGAEKLRTTDMDTTGGSSSMTERDEPPPLAGSLAVTLSPVVSVYPVLP
jgi:hypothetical protein